MTAREVELTGGAPWGFRMHGGTDQNQPLRISRRYSDSLERTLDVNPGRKASLSGIREGDVISSINGRVTKGMTNSDAHAMLRSAGPVLRLGLNEDRDMSPRRSIGKGSELKRPSQLIAEVQNGKATPQAPVYATIRSAQSPQHRPAQSLRGSLNSLPEELYSTQLVKSVAQKEESVRFHPTNPFFTTLPSSHTSVSKLPIPNSRASLFSLDRNKMRDQSHTNYNSDFKSPIFNSNTVGSGSTSLPYYHNQSQNTNGYKSYVSTINEKVDCNNRNELQNQSLPKNPFETKRNSDPFEKYLHQNSKSNINCDYDKNNMSNSISDNNFHLNENVTKRSVITEHKISEMEEVKTIKKIIMNGCDKTIDKQDGIKEKSEPANSQRNKFDGQTQFTNSNSKSPHLSPGDKRVLSMSTQNSNQYFTTHNHKEKDFNSIRTHESANKEKSAEAQTSEVVSKPPIISPRTPTTTASSPTPKRKYLK